MCIEYDYVTMKCHRLLVLINVHDNCPAWSVWSLPVSREYISWWRHQVETFSALLSLCVGNSPITGEFPSQRPMSRTFDVFFDLRLNKQLSRQSCGWRFETPSCPLWRHCNDKVIMLPATGRLLWFVSVFSLRAKSDRRYSQEAEKGRSAWFHGERVSRKTAFISAQTTQTWRGGAKKLQTCCEKEIRSENTND